tara:strand:- start:1906 stop:2826 length:921 start_codon:yes stop_codon:yes gene_type:complete
MENQVDEIQVQLEEAQNDAVEETVSLDEAESTEVNSGDSDDELDRYTRGVSKRINKLTAKYKAAEDRAVQAETRFAQMQNEVNALRKKQAVLDESYTSEYENRVKSQKEQAEELYRKAKETNDPDLEVKSVELLNKVALEEERVRLAKVQSEQNRVAQETQQNVVQAPQPVYDEPKPDEKAVAWAEKNSWFQKDRVKTYTAMGIHEDLTNEGYDGTEDEYYEEMDKRLQKVYPDLKSDANKDANPSVQRVASASNGSRQQAQGKRTGIKISSDHLSVKNNIKPRGMSQEDWLKRIGKEMLKIEGRQ